MTEAAPEIIDPPAPPGNEPPANTPPNDPPAGDPPATPPANDPPAGDPPNDPPADEKPAALPDNWRELAAGENEDQLKLLKRYGSLSGVVKALQEAQNTIRSGKIKRDMPDPKDEKAMAEWRKEQGIPDKPEGYQLPEPILKRLIDDDKPILSNFMERMHGKNWTPQQIQDGVEWYADFQEQIAEQTLERDTKEAEDSEDVLREQWARDEYKGNLALANRFWDGVGIEVKLPNGKVGNIAEARLPDGRKLGSIPEFVMWSSDRGRDFFGDVVFSSGDAETKFNNRKAEIEKIRNADFERYEAEGLDKEYRQIIETELKRAKR